MSLALPAQRYLPGVTGKPGVFKCGLTHDRAVRVLVQANVKANTFGVNAMVSLGPRHFDCLIRACNKTSAGRAIQALLVFATVCLAETFTALESQPV